MLKVARTHPYHNHPCMSTCRAVCQHGYSTLMACMFRSGLITTTCQPLISQKSWNDAILALSVKTIMVIDIVVWHCV